MWAAAWAPGVGSGRRELGGFAPAAASPLFELAGAVQGEGGFAARSVQAGAASAYFNPAFLADSAGGLELGFFVLAEEIGIRLRGRTSASADIPTETVDMEMPGGGRYPQYGLPTAWLNAGRPVAPPDMAVAPRPRQGAGSGHGARTYQVIGLVQRVFGGRVALGVHAMVPHSGFTRAAAFYGDEREQYFSNSLHPELYGDRMTAPSLAAGVGARVHRKLAIGAGTTLGLHTVATTPTYVSDLGHFENLSVDSSVGVKAALAPHFGIVYAVTEATALTATVHSPQKMQIDTDFSFLLSNGIQQRATVQFTHAYLPWTYAVGGSHRLFGTATGGGLSLTATARHARWSSYRDRHGQRPHPGYGWYDTTSGTVGLRWKGVVSSALLDVAYQPSPVPAQTGRTNYVDNDRVSAATGVGYRTQFLGGEVGLHLQVQGHRLLAREVSKGTASGGEAEPVIDEVPDDAVVAGQPLAGAQGLQTNNPGWPGFSSAGWVLALGLAINFIY